MRESCDKCGIAVEALYEIKTLAGPLYFCGHHKNEFNDAIVEQSYEVIDLKQDEKEEALV